MFATAACGRGGFNWIARDAAGGDSGDTPGGDDDLNQDPTVNDGIDLGPIVLAQLVTGAATTWNTYVHSSGGGPLALTNTPCLASDDFRACVHLAERQRVDVPKAAVCAGLAMADSRDAFDWECISHDGFVSFVSSGLKAGRGLRDLIDFANDAFEPISVTLTSRTGTWTSPAAVLWTNTILAAPLSTVVAGLTPLQGSEKIFLLQGSREDAFEITADGIAFVSAPGVVLTPNLLNTDVELQCAGWDTANEGYYNGPCAVVARGAKRLWIEIALGAFTDQSAYGIGIELTNVGWSQVHNLAVGQDYRTPLQLTDVTATRVVGLTSARAESFAIVDSDGNFFRDIRLAGLTGYLKRSSHNAFERVTSFGAEYGWTLTEDCVGDSFTQVLSFGHNEMAFHTADPGNSGLTVVGFTLASTAYQAMGAWKYDSATFHLGAVLNSGDMGFTIIGRDATISDLLTSEHVKAGINVDGGAGPQRFTGQIRSANNNGVCYADTSVDDPGFFTSTCEAEGLSDAYVLDDAFPKTAGSFVGNITVEPANTSAGNGRAKNPAQYAAFDFAGASNAFRGWVRSGAFLTPAQQDCAWLYAKNGYDPAGMVQLVDFSLKASDTVVRNRTLSAGAANNAFVDGASCPAGLDGNNVTRDVMLGEVLGDGVGNEDEDCDVGEACTGNVYLHGAIELFDDGYGDDDGLCESNERCLYAPNFGAYQGHGDGFLAHRCAFTDGIISGVRMYAYPTNGY